MAMNPPARQHLIDQLKVHTMQREYVAYVEGRATAPKGTWKNWLKPREDELRQFVVPKKDDDKTIEAITHYEVIAEFPLTGSREVITKLRLRQETGRKHQIRAQAAFAGLPLVGDRTYHPKYNDDAVRPPRLEFPRQALHAEVLTLEHPDKPGIRMSWTAELPRDLRQLEAIIRAGGRTSGAYDLCDPQ
jgi:23S rRNA pseudouridine1911/1915/1917 synthase